MFTQIYSNSIVLAMSVAFCYGGGSFVFKNSLRSTLNSHLTNMHNTKKKGYMLGMLCLGTKFSQKVFITNSEHNQMDKSKILKLNERNTQVKTRSEDLVSCPNHLYYIK